MKLKNWVVCTIFVSLCFACGTLGYITSLEMCKLDNWGGKNCINKRKNTSHNRRSEGSGERPHKRSTEI